MAAAATKALKKGSAVEAYVENDGRFLPGTVKQVRSDDDHLLVAFKQKGVEDVWLARSSENLRVVKKQPMWACCGSTEDVVDPKKKKKKKKKKAVKKGEVFEYKKLREHFEIIDTDGSGKIDKEELRYLLKKATGSAPTDDEVEKMIKDADANGNGLIDFEEFADIHARAKRGDLPFAALSQVMVQFDELLTSIPDGDKTPPKPKKAGWFSKKQASPPAAAAASFAAEEERKAPVEEEPEEKEVEQVEQQRSTMQPQYDDDDDEDDDDSRGPSYDQRRSEEEPPPPIEERSILNRQDEYDDDYEDDHDEDDDDDRRRRRPHNDDLVTESIQSFTP